MPTIVLWDIDNTLLYTGGAGGIGMNRAFRDLYGVQDGFGRVEFSGRSDAAIFADAARAHGIAETQVLAERARFLDAYIPHLHTAMREITSGRLMPASSTFWLPSMRATTSCRDSAQATSAAPRN